MYVYTEKMFCYFMNLCYFVLHYVLKSNAHVGFTAQCVNGMKYICVK